MGKTELLGYMDLLASDIRVSHLPERHKDLFPLFPMLVDLVHYNCIKYLIKSHTVIEGIN